jgi:hypothetical protein
VRVVRRHQGEVELPRELGEQAVHDGLLDEPVVLQLDEEVAGLDDLLEPREHRAGHVRAVLQQRLGHEAAEAAREHDEVLAQRGEVVEVRLRGAAQGRRRPRAGVQRDERAVALHRAGQHREVVGAMPAILVRLVARERVADSHLAPEDGLHVGVLALLVEVDGAVHVAVVGEGHGLHAQGLHPRHQLLHANRAVEHGVLGVNVEVNELCHRSSAGSTAGPSRSRK